MESFGVTEEVEVDVISLMEQKLPRYVMNCLKAAGYDEKEVIASMDTGDDENNSMTKIEKYIDKHYKNNPDMCPTISSSGTELPFEFPPGHRIRICNFVEEVKRTFKLKLSSRKAVSSSNVRSTPIAVKKPKIMAQAEKPSPLLADEIECRVQESIAKWLSRQENLALNRLENEKHYSVTTTDHGNGQISVQVNCFICHISVRLHPYNSHYQISNWTRHIKKCGARIGGVSSKQTKLSQLLFKTITNPHCPKRSDEKTPSTLTVNSCHSVAAASLASTSAIPNTLPSQSVTAVSSKDTSFDQSISEAVENNTFNQSFTGASPITEISSTSITTVSSAHTSSGTSNCPSHSLTVMSSIGKSTSVGQSLTGVSPITENTAVSLAGTSTSTSCYSSEVVSSTPQRKSAISVSRNSCEHLISSDSTQLNSLSSQSKGNSSQVFYKAPPSLWKGGQM